MLDCIYYPYSRPRTIETVKRALLLFDRVAFLDSQPDFVRRALTRRDMPDELDQADAVSAAIAYGSSEGVISIVDTKDVVAQHGSLITAATVADVQDDRFAAVAYRGGSGVWEILAERLPPEFLDAFYAGAGTFMESVTLQNIAGEADADSDFSRFRDFRWKGVDPEQAWKMLNNMGFRLVVGGNPHMRLPSYEVSFLPASSLRINEALLVAAAEEKVLFADSEVHDRLLRIKATKARGKADQACGRGIAELAGDTRDIAALSWRVINKLVTSEQLERYSIDDILGYRERNRRLLSRLRRAVATLSEELAAIDSEKAANRKLEELVDRKIIAEVEKAEDEVASNWQDFSGAAVLRTARGVVPAVAISVLAGLSPTQMLISAAGAGAAAMGNEGVKDAIALLQANRKARQHSFSYLTRL